MILTVGQILRYQRCGELYRLEDVEMVPNPPSSRRVISRIVREAIGFDLQEKLRKGTLLSTETARAGLDAIVRKYAGDIALTPEEAAGGLRRVYERVLQDSLRMYMVWRGAVAGRIEPSAVSTPFELTAGVHTVTGYIDVQEAGGIRTTKVRSRRPEDTESFRDLSLSVQALALEQMEGMPPTRATVDYLIDTKQAAYVRQEFDFDGGMLAAAQERLRIALAGVEEGSFAPAPADAWWCQSCPLRGCCRYVG